MSITEVIRTALYGIPPSPSYQPSKEGVIDAFEQVVQSVTLLTGGIVGSTATIRATLALLTSVSAANDTLGLVYNDPVIANNGIYHRKDGGWVFTGLLGTGPQGPAPTSAMIDTATAQAVAAAANAASAAASAEAAKVAVQYSGPTYTNVAAGEAATTNGQTFAVTAGAGITIWYRRTAGGSVITSSPNLYSGQMIPSLAVGNLFSPDATQQFIFCAQYAFDVATPIIPARYARIGSNPNHALSFQGADGSWWEIDESEIDIRQAGAVVGTNIKAAIERISATSLARRRTAIIPNTGADWLIKDANLINSMSIEFTGGATVIPADSDNTVSSTNMGFNIRGHDITIKGMRGRGQAGVNAAVAPPLYAWINTVRPADIGTFPPRLRNIKISDVDLFGAQHGMLLTSTENLTLENWEVKWQNDWGVVISGDTRGGVVRHGTGRYIGKTEALRVGVNLGNGSKVDPLYIHNIYAEHCGFLLGGGNQENYDFFCNRVGGLVIENLTSLNGAAGAFEFKAGATSLGDTVANTGYNGFECKGLRSIQRYTATKHVSMRHDPSGVPVATDSQDRVRAPILKGSTFINESYSDWFTAAIGAIATTALSRIVTITHTGHALQNGEYVMIRGISAAIGGVPAHELMTERVVRRVDANSYTILVETPATSAAASTTVATVYELAATPVSLPNAIITRAGDSNFDVTVPAHGLTAFDWIDLDGVVDIGGLVASELNGRFMVRSVVDANTVRFNCGSTAVSAVAGGGGAAVRVRKHKGIGSSTGVWLESVDDAICSSNIFHNIGVCYLLEGNTGGTPEPLISPTITGSIVRGSMVFARFNAGYIDNPQIIDNPDVQLFGPFEDYGGSLVAVRGGKTARNNVICRNGQSTGGGMFFHGRSLIGHEFYDNDFIGNSTAIYCLINAAPGEASSGVRINKNRLIVDNPNQRGTNVASRSALRLSETSAQFFVNDTEVLSGGTQAGILLENGATVAGANNIRLRTSTTTTPTLPATDGEVVVLTPGTAAIEKYQRAAGAWQARG